MQNNKLIAVYCIDILFPTYEPYRFKYASARSRNMYAIFSIELIHSRILDNNSTEEEEKI